MSDNLTAIQQDFLDVVILIKNSQKKAYAQINTTLIELYWELGKLISEKVDAQQWGKSVVVQLADYIQKTSPELKGFSDKNLWRMKQFYETYRDNEKLAPLVRELPWKHNIIVFSRCKSDEEREFYLRLCINERYSKRELERQIDALLIERSIQGIQKLSAPLKDIHPSSAKVFKDEYILEFLGLPEQHSENDLQKALVQNMKKFILELGKDFIFIHQEYRLQVGNQDFYID